MSVLVFPGRVRLAPEVGGGAHGRTASQVFTVAPVCDWSSQITGQVLSSQLHQVSGGEGL